MIVTILQINGKSAVVAYWDSAEDMMVAYIISTDDLPAESAVGDRDVQIHHDAIITGTEYGIDWSLIIDADRYIHIMTKAFRARGLWTFADIMAHSNVALDAVRSTAASIVMEIMSLSDTGE